MTDRHRDDDAPRRYVAFASEHATRAETELAGAAIERAAEAVCRARGVRPPTRHPPLVVRVGALRTRDLAAALAAEGVPARTARALAPHLDRDALAALDPDAWVSLSPADGVPAAEHDTLLRLGTLAIEAAETLAAVRSVPYACVVVETRERSPEGPWVAMLAAGEDFCAMSKPGGRALLGEIRDRLVAARPGGVAP